MAYRDLLIKEKRAIDYYLRHQGINRESLLNLYEQAAEYSEFLDNNFKPDTADLFEWANSEYPKNPKYPEKLIYKTSAGRMVRSKSEVIIASMLERKEIPFQYECELALGDFIFYPDFKIIHPRTRELFWWEHFGRCDDPKYINKTTHKLNVFLHFGIVPGINLITTYETEAQPLDITIVANLINHYFQT